MGLWLKTFVGVAWLATAASAAEPPNIVVVIGDDHAWPYSGFMGHEVVETPTLDRLAEAGTVFTHAQAPASICGPSLRTLLSGLHPNQWRAKRLALADQGQDFVPTQEVIHYRTLPRELARNGYLSWQGGKMSEGSFEQAGFTQGTATRPPKGRFKVEGVRFGRDGWDPTRCGPTREGDALCPAMDALRAFLQETADRPFLLWFAPMVPHVPFDPPEAFLDLYADRGLSDVEVRYFAQVSRLDAIVAELLRELEATDSDRETLIVYLSDNGWEIGQGFFGKHGHGKGSLHELGTRTPIIFHWPGHVPGGRVREEVVTIEDLFATLLDFAGAEALPDRRGRSLVEAIRGDAAIAVEPYVSFYYGSAPEHRGHFVRTPRWRFISTADGREQLFRIDQDPYERKDLVEAHPEITQRFRHQIQEWDRQIVEAPDRLEVVGRLVSSEGEPLSGVQVELVSESLRLAVPTDARGGFRFRNLPAGDYVLAPGSGLATIAGTPGVSLPIGPTGSDLGERVAEPRAPERAVPTTSLRGRVRSSEGGPLADTLVVVRRLSSRDAREVRVLTDRAGDYRADALPAGHYLVHVSAETSLFPAWHIVELEDGVERIRDVVF